MKTNSISRYVCADSRASAFFCLGFGMQLAVWACRFGMRADLLLENRDPKRNIVGIHLSVHASWQSHLSVHDAGFHSVRVVCCLKHFGNQGLLAFSCVEICLELVRSDSGPSSTRACRRRRSCAARLRGPRGRAGQ